MKSAKRLLLLVPLLLAAAVAVGSLLAFSPRNQSQRPLIVSAVERDAAIPVLPWIPCSNASAHILTAHTVRVQQMRLASTFSQTYAAAETTHLGMLGRLTGLVAARQYGADTTLCEPSGGIDRVSVLRLRQQGARGPRRPFSSTSGTKQSARTTGLHSITSHRESCDSPTSCGRSMGSGSSAGEERPFS
jgi:hypothetical protein